MTHTFGIVNTALGVSLSEWINAWLDAWVYAWTNAWPDALAQLSARIPNVSESVHCWALFLVGHSLHVLKRASLSAQSKLSGTKTRVEWLRTNALALAIRFFVSAAGFSYWIAHPDAATHIVGTMGVPVNLTLEPGHATSAMFGLSADSMVDWAAAKVPFLQKEIPAVSADS